MRKFLYRNVINYVVLSIIKYFDNNLDSYLILISFCLKKTPMSCFSYFDKFFFKLIIQNNILVYNNSI